MIINHSYNKRGFTLMELLLYMGLLAIFLLVLTQVFLSSLDSLLESQANSTVEQDSRFIFSRLNYDLAQADSLSTPTLGQTSSSLVLTRSGGQLTFSLQGNNLVITDSTGTYQLNSYATDVTNISFTRLGNSGGKNSMQVAFTIKSKTLKGATEESKTFNTTLGTR